MLIFCGHQYDILSIFPVIPFSSQVEELFEAKSRALFKLELELLYIPSHSVCLKELFETTLLDPFGSFWHEAADSQLTPKKAHVFGNVYDLGQQTLACLFSFVRAWRFDAIFRCCETRPAKAGGGVALRTPAAGETPRSLDLCRCCACCDIWRVTRTSTSPPAAR